MNKDAPSVMHIDLNSCFATVEQQARPGLRGRPVAVLNRKAEHAMIITASYEAKALGVGLGMSFREAKRLCPELVGLESDPPKYRYVYHQLMRIMNDYSAHVRMKSIDEGVIDFSEAPASIRERGLVEIGYEIKQRLRDEIGCAMRCNVGISTNRFLAKTAAGLNKPDGLNLIDHTNLHETFAKLKLTDLTGVAERNQARLESVGIFTPLGFLAVDETTLRKIVFKSIDGTKWHKRLRGFEVDKVDFAIKSAGRQYVLEDFNLTRGEILQRLHHLCEETGAKIRSQNMVARGIMVHAREMKEKGSGWGGKFWRSRKMLAMPIFSDEAIFAVARELFAAAPENIKEIGVTCYELSPAIESDVQLQLFSDELARTQAITGAIDDINARYGTRKIHSADTLPTKMIKVKIPFGSTRYL